MTTSKGDAFAVYLDTNVFIDLVEGDNAVAAPVRSLFEAVMGGAGSLVTSEITLAEVLAPSRAFGPRSEALKQRYLSAVLSNPLVTTRPITRDILLATAELRLQSAHKLPDAIHCATAVQAGCRFLVSRDKNMRNLPDGIVHVEGDAAAIADLIGALRD